MTIYGIIRHDYDWCACEWYHNAEHIEVFQKKEDRDRRMALLNTEKAYIDRQTWDDFEVELQ